MLHIDVKYMLLSSGRLRNFKQKSNHLWNASCPVCGDSKTNVSRARLYFYRHNNNIKVKCHNCHYFSSFGKFLLWLDPSQHRDYTCEKYLAKRIIVDDVADVIPIAPETLRTAQVLSIPSMPDLVATHPARAYIESRRIPEKFWDELYYAENYKAFLDKDFPEHGKEDIPDDARIVIPMFNHDNYISYVTGRDLKKKSNMRYVTVKILEERKVFGLNRLSDEAPCYVVEGPIDSFFLPNAVASADANLIGTADYIKTLGFDMVTLVFDNQPRNYELVVQIERAIDKGYKVTLLPYDENAKDLNEMVINGWSLIDVHNFVDQHTYQGHMAMLEFIKWRKR